MGPYKSREYSLKSNKDSRSVKFVLLDVEELNKSWLNTNYVCYIISHRDLTSGFIKVSGIYISSGCID